MNIGIIRCMQTEDYCPGSTDFRMIREKKGAFEVVDEEINIIGFVSCGGCPGKKAASGKRTCETRCGYDCICILHTQGHSHRISMSICKKNESVHCSDVGR
jgi:predicted metal-binding protein